MNEITDRQQDVYDALAELATSAGPPTLQEIGDKLGVSRVTVHFHMLKLERAGLVAKGARGAWVRSDG